MLIIAHRGASHDAPENTLAAFRLAWEQGADAVECDVRLTADGEVVVMHDEDTLRTTGEKLVVAETSLDRLRELDAGSWKREEFRGERIPLLTEALDVVPERRGMVIEVKCGPEIVPALKDVIAASGKAEAVRVISFDREVLLAVKEALPRIPLMLLGMGNFHLPWTGKGTPPEELLEFVVENGLAGLSLFHLGFKREFVQRVHDAGKELHAWPVDDPARARELMEWGIDGLGTNRPGLIRDALT
jgi:glycerophosphoryl diester phosphodiesterase